MTDLWESCNPSLLGSSRTKVDACSIQQSSIETPSLSATKSMIIVRNERAHKSKIRKQSNQSKPITPRSTNTFAFKMRMTMASFLPLFLALASVSQAASAQELTARTNLRSVTASSTDSRVFAEEDHRRLVPSGCPSDAIEGTCSNCNSSGCGAFECSAFTHWSCPSGYTVCGYEKCASGFCTDKKWCSKN